MALLNNLGLPQWAAWVDQRFMKKQTILGSNPETTGPKVTGVDPGTLGQMALDSTNVYICTVAGDSESAIWKAISLEDVDDLSLYQLITDNTLATTNKTIVGAINEVREIALGAQKAFVFYTEVDMNAWLLIPTNVAKLSTGNYLLIREVNVPDYWWDGTTNMALELEVKIDLTNYYNKTETDNLLNAIIIGGRNYLNNSSFEYDYTSLINNIQTGTTLTEELGNNSSKSLGIKKSVSDGQLGYVILKFNAVPAGTYMFNFDTKSDIGGQAISGNWEIFIDGGLNPIAVVPKPTVMPTEWSRTGVEVTVPVNTGFAFVLRPNTGISWGTIYYDNFKLELGNKATDWTPNPDDVNLAVYKQSIIHALIF